MTGYVVVVVDRTTIYGARLHVPLRYVGAVGTTLEPVLPRLIAHARVGAPDTVWLLITTRCYSCQLLL